jgi:transcriptional regulator with XRE-family HTH domain
VADALAELFAQLAAVRRRQGSTQAQVGAALGLTGVSIANWEGGRVPSAGNFVLWAEALSQRLVVVDGVGAVWTASRPVPRLGGEETHLYRLRVLALTLRNVRESSGALQPEVGARLGVSGWTVQMWENARRVPRLPRLVTWCDVLGCRLELRRRR